MSIRRAEIYISREAKEWLYLIAKSESVPEENRIVTADEIGDQILRQAIREQHPELPEHQKAIEKLEQQTIKKLQHERKHNTES